MRDGSFCENSKKNGGVWGGSVGSGRGVGLRVRGVRLDVNEELKFL